MRFIQKRATEYSASPITGPVGSLSLDEAIEGRGKIEKEVKAIMVSAIRLCENDYWTI